MVVIDVEEQFGIVVEHTPDRRAGDSCLASYSKPWASSSLTRAVMARVSGASGLNWRVRPL